MRGYTITSHNYLLAHMLFVVSNEQHNNFKPGETKYTGGRVFIDFPIFERGMIGKYPHAMSGGHSEDAYSNFLKNDNTIEAIVALVQDRLLLAFNCYKGFKVYAINLLLNSQKNVCSWCEPLLYDLMTSNIEGSFRAKIKAEMHKKSFITSDKSEKPYITVTVSAHEYYNEEKQHYVCSSKKKGFFKLTQQAQYALNCKVKPSPLSLDIKQIVGKVILSTPERWLSEDLKNMESQQIESTTKIPCYSGFRSAAGCCNRLEEVLSNSDNENIIYSDLKSADPYYFDGYRSYNLEEGFTDLNIADRKLSGASVENEACDGAAI